MTATPEVLMVCGTGGVGKTTASAVLAIAAALEGRRTCVLTIDPARRLADALGVQLGHEPTRVPLPDAPDARLDALMLDRKAAWDTLVVRHLGSRERAAPLLANRYYRAVSERLSGGHEFMAIETLHQLATTPHPDGGRYDLLVIDTPPSQHALDVLAAPERIHRILDQRLLAALLRPGTGLVGAATRGLTEAVRRLAGDTVLSDLGAFFDLVGPISEGFARDSAEVARLFRAPGTRALLVRSALAPPDEETPSFLVALRGHGLRFAGFLLNRATLAEGPVDGSRPAPRPPPPSVSAADWEAELSALHDWALARARRADATRRATDQLRRAGGAEVLALPDQPGGLADLHALTEAARHLVGRIP